MHHEKFCENKTMCDLKIIRDEIATAP